MSWRFRSVEIQDSQIKVIQVRKGFGMHRFVLTDAQSATMEPLCLGKRTDPSRAGGDNRLFLKAVLWIARTGSHLPPTFANWNAVFKRYRNWVQAGVFRRIFDAVSDDPDMEFAMVDATIVKVHGHAQESAATRSIAENHPVRPGAHSRMSPIC
jgi:transposase